MRRTLLATALLLAACSPVSERADPTSTLDVTTTARIVTTITTVETTSTTEDPTTTSTTTTLETTTTTSEVLDGNWADQPLIVTGFGALGWWDGTDWVRAETEGALPVVGGEDYQIAVIGLEATTAGGPQDLVCEPVFNLGVVLEDDHLLGEWPGPYGVAISAPWDLQPNLFEAFADDGTFAAIASSLLAERGLVVADPAIKQLFRTDLEGDGINEVLVVAEDIRGGFLPEVGDYSIIFMQKVIEGDVQTVVLGDSVITDPEGSFMVSFSVGAVADLSGDGQMEIVVDSAFFEGLGVHVWEYVDDDIGLFPYLQTGCGS
ncbi:MAG: hypothetical protein V3S26_01585 [Acidimicrobiia bacterium]